MRRKRHGQHARLLELQRGETLRIRRKNPDGSFLCVHSWATGYQALTITASNLALIESAAKGVQS